jgi:drug/metabolite transporter (DMT)-like permease
MMNDGRGRDTGQLAIAVGVVAAGSAVCLATFYAVRGPFGTINDIGNAATGVLSGLLAWRLRRQLSGSSGAVVGSALVGAAITVVGSALVVSGTTGFFLAGLVSGVGFAGIGVWLVALNRSAFAVAAWPARIRALGVAAGVLMAFGFLSVPGILLRLDDMATAPGWVWLGFVGWFGTFVVYPAWAIWLGVAEARRADLAVQSPLTPTV